MEALSPAPVLEETQEETTGVRRTPPPVRTSRALVALTNPEQLRHFAQALRAGTLDPDPAGMAELLEACADRISGFVVPTTHGEKLARIAELLKGSRT